MVITIRQKDLDAERGIFGAFFLHSGWSYCEPAPTREKTYDYKGWGQSGGGPIYVEVKCDWESQKSNNAFFEFANTALQANSGLAVTRASVWLHYLVGRQIILKIDPKALLWWLSTHLTVSTKYRIRLSGKQSGDKNSQGYIVPIDVLLSREWIHQIPFVLTNVVETGVPR